MTGSNHGSRAVLHTQSDAASDTLLSFKSRGTIYSRVKAGQLKLNKIGSRAVRISSSSLAAYLAAVEAATLETLQVNQASRAKRLEYRRLVAQPAGTGKYLGVGTLEG